MRIVMLDGYPMNPGDLSWERFEKLGEFILYDRTASEDVAERIAGADAVLTNKTPLTRSDIYSSDMLKYIGVTATGYNVVDCEAAKERGISVTNIPTYGTAAVGQYAIALLLEICHHIGHHDVTVKEGKWEKCPYFSYWDYPLVELNGKTMGIIGLGRIGQVTARIAGAMGMKVLAYDGYESDSGRAVAEYVSMDTLLKEADVVVLHCLLTAETESLINKDSIAKMKDGAILINNSRGALVVEQDLAEALNSGKLAAAGLDVLLEEPVKTGNPLLTAKNCIITPHISWAPKECRQRIMDGAADNLESFLQGNPVNVVNK